MAEQDSQFTVLSESQQNVQSFQCRKRKLALYQMLVRHSSYQGLILIWAVTWPLLENQLTDGTHSMIKSDYSMCGLATHYIPSNRLEDVLTNLYNCDSEDHVNTVLNLYSEIGTGSVDYRNLDDTPSRHASQISNRV